MAKRVAEPKSLTVGGALSAAEVEKLDALLRRRRMETGEQITRSSLVREILVNHLAAQAA